jgi:hypothetical protein
VTSMVNADTLVNAHERACGISHNHKKAK